MNPLRFFTQRHCKSPASTTPLLKRLVTMGVLSLVLMMGLPLVSWSGPESLHIEQLQESAPITADIKVPGGESKRVSIQVTDRSVRDVLRDLAEEGEFNLALDDSVEGNITLELNNVTVNDAISSISGIAGIEVLKKGSDIFLAIGHKTAAERGLTRQLSKIVKNPLCQCATCCSNVECLGILEPSGARWCHGITRK